MRSEKGWLQGQMESAKREMNDWQGWKRDTIRKEISNRLSTEKKGDFALVRSPSSGKWILRERTRT
jgi:hypothetical protein